MKIAVIGGGKMGLPLACQLADNGASVTVCDINPRLVEQINRSEPPFEEPELPAYLARNVGAGRLRATTDTPTAVAGAGTVIIIVPALLTADHDIDYSNLRAASVAAARGLQPGTLVCYETTLPPGGCRTQLAPVLETGGLRVGRDLFVCFSPERVKSQFVFKYLRNTPKVVGGYDLASAARGEEFYTHCLKVKVLNVGTLEAAELVKLAGMLYRDVNIALANELATLSEALGLDFAPIRAAGNTDGEASLLEPGIGVGGHCTPVYPYFLLNAAERLGVPQRLATYGRLVNEEQPARHVGRLKAALGSLAGKRVHLLGLGFRPDVKEYACSPAFPLRDELVRQGAVATIEDPWYQTSELTSLGFTPATVGADGPEAIILNTAHSAFLAPDFRAWREAGVRVVVDGRNVWPREAVQQAGLIYLGVGMPAPTISPPAIPVARPALGWREARNLDSTLCSGWVMQGPRVAAFEAAFAARTGAPHACAVSSGTTALHLALLGAGVRPGDVVLTVSLSFIATANAIRLCQAEPIFVDVDPATLNLCPGALAHCLENDFTQRDGSLWYRRTDRLLKGETPLRDAAGPIGRLAGLLVVHQIGMPCDLGRILPLARQYALPVVEDAACAIGSEVSLDNGQTWTLIGKPHGLAACFSFHPRKILTTGDGGMLTTSQPDLDHRFRLWRQHGMGVTSAARHAASNATTDSCEVAGYNYRLTDLQAAVGLAQLDRLPGILSQRRQVAAAYMAALAGSLGVRLPAEPAYARSNWQSFQVHLARAEWQRPVMQALLDQGISTRPGIICSHREPPYRNAWPEGSLPHSEAAARTGLILPLYQGQTEGEVRRVVEALIAALRARSSRAA